MKFHLANPGDTQRFTAHGLHHVVVSGARYDHSIVVLPDKVHTGWSVSGFEELGEAHFTYLMSLKPEILLLGTGSRQRFPHPRLYRALTDNHIALECMDTPAACRTYNILVAEDRNVAAAILFDSDPSTLAASPLPPLNP